MKRTAIISAILLLCVALTAVADDFKDRPIWPDTKEFVKEMYLRILNRLPSNADTTSWTRALRSCNLTREDMIDRMFASTEYCNRARTNLEFVYDLFDAIMRRAASNQELKFWNFKLIFRSREQLVNTFLNSAEYENNIGQYENDCWMQANLAFQADFPNGRTITDICDHEEFDIPELREFEIEIKLKGLISDDPNVYKGHIFYLYDSTTLGYWDYHSYVRKYGIAYPDYSDQMKFTWVGPNQFIEDVLGTFSFDPNHIYTVKMRVTDNEVKLWWDGVNIYTAPKYFIWDPGDQYLFLGAYFCSEGEGGYGSIPGATYFSVKIWDLEQ